jgi:hypothetical protein
LAQGKATKQLFALLSRVYLYLGDDANVILYGNLALAGNTVCPRASMVGLWDDVNSAGVLFKLELSKLMALLLGLYFHKL